MLHKMMLTSLVNAILALADPEMMRQFLKALLDFVEDHVEGSASKIDDALILPICSSVRKAFGVPDKEEHVSPVYKPE